MERELRVRDGVWLINREILIAFVRWLSCHSLCVAVTVESFTGR